MVWKTTDDKALSFVAKHQNCSTLKLPANIYYLLQQTKTKEEVNSLLAFSKPQKFTARCSE